MRVLIALLVALVPFVSLPAAEPPLIVVKLTSVRAALDDLEGLGAFDDPQAERERFLYEMVEPLRLPLGAWLDRERPVLLTTTQAGLMGDQAAIVALLPVLDVDDALRALGADPASEPEDGIHELRPEEDLRWYVVGEDDYLTVGLRREGVAAFERDALEGLEFPPGSMGLQLDLEVVAPLLQGLISTRRETMKQQFVELREQQESAAEQGQAPEHAVDPDALAGMMDFYFDTALTILRNTSRIQVSLGRGGDGAVLHTRVAPTKDSALEALLAAQPVGFGKLGRAVPEGPALVSYSGNFRLTDDAREDLSQFVDSYAVMLEGMKAMMPPEMSSFSEMLGDQMDMAKKRFDCIAGEMAGVWDMGGDDGMRSIQLSRTLTKDDCETLADEEVEVMRQLLAPDGEPLVTVSEPNVVPGDVRAMRVEIDMERLVGDDEAATELMRGMFAGRGPVTYFGQAGDVTVGVTGPDAEQTFSEVVDRLQTRRKRGGLTPEIFAPLEAGAGVFAVIDLSRLDLPALFGGTAATEEPEEGEDVHDAEDDAGLTGRVVIGAHAERGLLAVDVALPAEVVRSLFENDTEEGVPPDLWPPPQEPARPEEPASEAAPHGTEAEAEAADKAEAIRIAGDGTVTLPVVVHKIKPDYPEALRLARLEGSVVLQAVVTREGTVQDVELLSCSGKHPDEPQPRTNLLHASAFCTALSDAATAAVERWRYEPARDGDEPVDVYFTIRVDFELK